MKRPVGVTIIGGLMFLQGLPLGLLAAAEVAERLDALPAFIPPEVTRQFELVVPAGLLAAVIWGGLAVLLLLGGIGILLLRPWAWLLAMVLQGVTLANLLYGFSLGRQNYTGMVLGAAVVFYLNSRPVRLAFDLARRRVHEVGAPTTSESVTRSSVGASAADPLKTPSRRHRRRATARET